MFSYLTTSEKDTDLIPDLENYLTKANDKYFKRQEYWKYLLKDILLNNKPKCEPLTKEEKVKNLIQLINGMPGLYQNNIYWEAN